MGVNLAFGWLWVLAGLLGGLLLGLFFHQEDWFGGYASFRRRLLRLGHVSLVALGFLNILFALTAQRLQIAPPWPLVASRALLVGAVAMPLCCVLAAWKPGLRHLFAVPIAALLLGAGVVARGLFS